MRINSEPISSYAMCRECAKEFSSKKHSFRAMYIKIAKHIKTYPGHIVIGSEQIRVIFKG